MSKLLKLHLDAGVPIQVNADRIATAIFCDVARQTKVVLGWLPWAKCDDDTDHIYVDESPEQIATMMAS